MNNRKFVILDGPGAGEDNDATSEASSMDLDEAGRSVNTRKNLIPKPPVFYGKRSELSYFLSRVETYFKYNLESTATDEEKVDILSCFLGGKAADWYSELVKEESSLLESYEDFKVAMQERYKTCASSDVANMQLTKIYFQITIPLRSTVISLRRLPATHHSMTRQKFISSRWDYLSESRKELK